mmetsp:Transcript_13859/g.27235  ORF Transcript_13859/g.27235 Transcript_13859/m.27235 type:complete len:531 (-) Transcript_13859:267-1859(-)
MAAAKTASAAAKIRAAGAGVLASPKPASAVPGLPTVPFLGSMRHLTQRYGDPKRAQYAIQLDNYQKFCKEMGSRVWTSGIPGIGAGVSGTLYTCADPEEYLKVIRQEGKYPRGMIESMWPNRAYFTKYEKPTLGQLFSEGEDWRRLRVFMQKNLLAPLAAREYVPGICKAAEIASRGAPVMGHNLHHYLSRCSFDLFCSAFYGRMTKSADASSNPNPNDVRYCENVLETGLLTRELMYSPTQLLLHKLGFTSSRLREFYDVMDNCAQYSSTIIDDFIQRANSGDLDDIEKQSYLHATMDLLKNEKNDVTETEMRELLVILLIAAADTTSSLLNWSILSLAFNPRVQDKLREEVKSADSDAVSSKNGLPYLQAVIRESYRIRPPIANQIFKEVSHDTEICGYTIPAQSTVVLSTFGVQNDPDLVENPRDFVPERFLPDAVAARAGTPSEVIDHLLCRGPFSAGARMCPGYRVASFELVAMLAQLVKDWRIELDLSSGCEYTRSLKTVHDVECGFGLVIVPDPGPKLKFTPV